MKYDIITIGGATEDIALHTNEGVLIDNKNDILRQKLLAFEYGAKIKINKSTPYFGGGAANVAVAASLLGLRASALVAVGDDDRGVRIIKNLKSNSVDVALVEKIKDTESGFSFLLVAQDNEHIVFSARGANSELRITNYELQKLKNAKWVYLTSLSGKWEDVLRKTFSVKGVKFAWNPGHIQLKGGVNKIGKFLKKTEVLILNKDEALELALSSKKYSEKDNNYLGDMNNLLRIIKEFGPKITVITNGRFGAHAFNGTDYYYQPIIKEKKVMDTTGVGDAFGSSFISGLEIYKDIKKALNLGARNTSSAISHLGAQNGLLTKKDLK